MFVHNTELSCSTIHPIESNMVTQSAMYYSYTHVHKQGYTHAFCHACLRTLTFEQFDCYITGAVLLHQCPHLWIVNWLRNDTLVHLTKCPFSKWFINDNLWCRYLPVICCQSRLLEQRIYFSWAHPEHWVIISLNKHEVQTSTNNTAEHYWIHSIQTSRINSSCLFLCLIFQWMHKINRAAITANGTHKTPPTLADITTVWSIEKNNKYVFHNTITAT